MSSNEINNVLEQYNKINNSFSKKIVFHVGDGAGFYSEVNAMMQCMLWCYARQIKFELYADDANFTGGHGWNTFFESFCDESHDRLHHYGNHRYRIGFRNYKNVIQFKVSEFILKKIKHIDYLTQDIFTTAIDRSVSQVEIVDCEPFGVHGVNFEEFAKLIKYVMRFNPETKAMICDKIASLNLPHGYCSVQIRGGDKLLEYEKLNDVDVIVDRMLQHKNDIENLFVFTDDYSYVEHIREKYKNINVFTLTKENERGYVNDSFQKASWESKKDDLIKLFAMVEICVKSDVHFGNEYTCVNQYIKYLRKIENKEYHPIWMREDAGLVC